MLIGFVNDFHKEYISYVDCAFMVLTVKSSCFINLY